MRSAAFMSLSRTNTCTRHPLEIGERIAARRGADVLAAAKSRAAAITMLLPMSLALGKIDPAQEHGADLVLSRVFVAGFRFDGDMPAVEGGEAGFLAAFARTEMIDQR